MNRRLSPQHLPLDLFNEEGQIRPGETQCRRGDAECLMSGGMCLW